MIKRWGLFFLVNLGVMLTLGLTTHFLGLNRYLSSVGLDYQTLAGFCLVYGMGGAFISLLLSRTMAKAFMNLRMVSEDSSGVMERRLYEMVARLAKMNELPMPEVGIYPSVDVNAFATGPTRNQALVAVSTGLLQSMDGEELEGVLAHELAHVANGDMVTMTLLQGVMNAFVMFFSKAIAWSVAQSRRSENEAPSYGLAMVIEMVLYVVFGFLSGMIVAAFSRWREYRADRGGAKMAGTHKMIAALERLKKASQLGGQANTEVPNALASLQISSKSSKWIELFSTHPSLESRISRLRNSPEEA